MKKTDKFVKEKLDILHDTSNSEFTPFYISEKNPKISEEFAAHFANIKKQKQSTKTDIARKKKLIFGVATGAIALVLISVFTLIGILNNGNGNNGIVYYNDSELVENKYSLVEFQEEFNVILPIGMNDINSTIWVYSHETENINVHADISFNTSEEERITLKIVFVENYLLMNEQLYNLLPQADQTTLFSYNYVIPDDIEVAYAKFIYNGYRYYLKLSSEIPENIIDILESFI